MELVSDRRYRLPAEPESVWSAFTDVRSYRRWWPWLREFDAAELTTGADWRCAVRPPLPYTVRFTITLVDVVELEVIRAQVRGDIVGEASVHLVATGEGSEVRITSRLSPTGGALSVLATVARPIVARAHDWIIDTGARQFAERAV